jgi:hypothetical protein
VVSPSSDVFRASRTSLRCMEAAFSRKIPTKISSEWRVRDLDHN